MLENINKIDKSLARLIKDRRERGKRERYIGREGEAGREGERMRIRIRIEIAGKESWW